jgi:hypothetical protein
MLAGIPGPDGDIPDAISNGGWNGDAIPARPKKQ